MSFGKRGIVLAPTRTSAAGQMASGWWRAYGLSLLAAMVGNVIMAFGVGVFAEIVGKRLAAETDLTFGHYFPRALLASVGLLFILAPVFAVVGGVLRRLRVVRVLAYVSAIAFSCFAVALLLTGPLPDRFALGAIALMSPGVLFGGLTLGWSLRPRA